MTVATPDYTVTPAGADYGDPRQQHDGIVAANATMARSASVRAIAWVDIFDISLRAALTAHSSPSTGCTRAARSTPCGSTRIRPVVEALVRS